jgi:hypothetical protein
MDFKKSSLVTRMSKAITPSAKPITKRHHLSAYRYPTWQELFVVLAIGCLISFLAFLTEIVALHHYSFL